MCIAVILYNVIYIIILHNINISNYIQDPSCFTQTVCTICKGTFRQTKANIEIHTHWQAKHADHAFEKCFPGQNYEVNGKVFTAPAPAAAAPAAPAAK